ncbi:unnamed protein product, partial [Choristocarpus tenellus]
MASTSSLLSRSLTHLGKKGLKVGLQPFRRRWKMETGLWRTPLQRSLNSSGQRVVDSERLGSSGGVLRLTLNRPESLNALTRGMMHDLLAAVQSSTQPPAIPKEKEDEARPPRLVILRGAGGRAFCAGGDVKAIAAERELTEPGRPG